MNSLTRAKSRFDFSLTNRLVIMVLASTACFLWGSAISVVKVGYAVLAISPTDYGSQILFAGIRFTLAGLAIVVIFSLKNRNLVRPSKATVGMTFKLSIFQTTGQYLFYYIGIANTTGAKAAIIQGSNVFVAIVISSIIFSLEKFTLNKAIGCLIGFVGIVLVNLSNLGSVFEFNLIGDGFIFLSVVLYSLSAILIKNYAKAENTVVLSSYQFIWGGLVMSAAGMFLGGVVPFDSWAGLLVLVYLAFVSAVAYTIWGTLLKHNDVSSVTIYGFVTPVMGVILAAVLLGEHQSINIFTIAALVLVSVGIYIVNRKRA